MFRAHVLIVRWFFVVMKNINWWSGYLLKIVSTSEVTAPTEQCMGKDLEGAAAIYHCISFDILLTVHLNIFILILTNLMHKIL